VRKGQVSLDFRLPISLEVVVVVDTSEGTFKKKPLTKKRVRGFRRKSAIGNWKWAIIKPSTIAHGRLR